MFDGIKCSMENHESETPIYQDLDSTNVSWVTFLIFIISSFDTFKLSMLGLNLVPFSSYIQIFTAGWLKDRLTYIWRNIHTYIWRNIHTYISIKAAPFFIILIKSDSCGLKQINQLSNFQLFILINHWLLYANVYIYFTYSLGVVDIRYWKLAIT